MAMIKRAPGLMGLVKQKAKRQGMYQVPKRYQPEGGEEEYPAFVNKEEMALLKKQGGSGHMTPYGIPSFATDDDFVSQTGGGDAGNFGERGRNERDFSYNPADLFNPNKKIDVGGWLKDKFGGGDASNIRRTGGISGAGREMEEINRRLGPTPIQLRKEREERERKAAEEKKKQAYERDRMEDYQKGQELSKRRDSSLKEFDDYKQQTKELTKGFGEDVEKLGAYQSKFDTMAGEAKTRGDEAETAYGTAAETGAGKLEGVGEDARKAFDAGAEDVSTVKDQFGKEGFQKDIRGMSEAALDSDLGQRDAELLKGRMEEQRLASQKGSEEKLRRELAQSGASPSEIAAKVAQFQRQSAADQSQAGRSESLQANIQGRQMGQQSLSQAAQLKGQEAGMAGKQAGLAVQQAQLKGQGLAMEGQMAQAGAGMRMQGIQGGAQLGFQGADQQASMMGQGIGAVQAAGGARQQQMGGISEQAGYTQAQLADTVAQQTQAYQEEQARLTRAAQGTPDDPRWRPPEQPANVMPATAGLPPGTTIAPPPGRPIPQGIAQPGGIMGQGGLQAMSPEQQQVMNAQGEEMRKARMQGFKKTV